MARRCVSWIALAAVLTFPATGRAAVPLPFVDDFSADRGWIIGIEWERGTAEPSFDHIQGNPDPEFDHTPTADDYVLGAVIGGAIGTSFHPFYYAMSPVIDAGGVPNLELSFWRWLNADYTPYMESVVEVFDGTQWVQIYTTGPAPATFDSEWMEQVFDVSAYANPGFQVRFGHYVGNMGVWVVSGWNVDDVQVRVVPAELEGSITVEPNPASIGEWTEIVFTVTNVGRANATGVTPLFQINSGASVVEYQAGPVPPGPVLLVPGASQSFTWTYSVSGNGSVGLTVTATGTDAALGGTIASNGEDGFIVASPLRESLAISPDPASVGEWIQIVMSVTNEGSADVTNVTPDHQVDGGAALLDFQSGPVPPGPVTLNSGSSQHFTWTYSVSGWGAVSVTATATGTDTVTGGGVMAAVSRGFTTFVGSCPNLPRTIHAVSGDGTPGYRGDGGPASAAWVNNPYGVAVDGAGNVYVADTSSHRVRRIDAATGVITTVAGTGTGGYNGDGIAATSAWLYEPSSVALDGAGNMYIADRMNHRIRKVAASTGLISTIAGTGTGGYDFDGVSATTARIYYPRGVAVDGAGNVYIADYSNHRVRVVNAGTGFISTFAGTGTGPYNGDGIAATSANIYYPAGVAGDGAGNVYIADQYNHRIRMVSGGTIQTIAGTGASGYNGDGIAATVATLYYPWDVDVDGSGNVYIADRTNMRVRRVDAGTLRISTIAGMGFQGYNGDGQDATEAWMNYPSGVAVSPTCRVYIADTSNQRIRILLPSSLDTRLDISPPNPSVGQWPTVTLTVTNVGNVDVVNLTPHLHDNFSKTVLQSGPVPPGPLTLGPGAMTAFVWTVSVSGSGTAQFTATATGTDSGSGEIVLSNFGRPFLFLEPAILDVAVAVDPPSILKGQWFSVNVTVTNTGQVTASNVKAELEPNENAVAVEYQSGPVPPGPIVLVPGASQTFVWSYSTSGLGKVTFTATATGNDVNTGVKVQDSATAWADGTTLDVAVAVDPWPIHVGEWGQVVLTVTNVGSAVAANVTPHIQVNYGAGLVVGQAGPVPPGPVSLDPTKSQSFTWTYSCSGSGTVQLTATATGTDSGAPKDVWNAATRAFAIYPDQWDPADDFGITATLLSPTPVVQSHGPHGLSMVDTEDWYRVNMIAGVTYHFSTTGGSGDNWGYLYSDAAGTILMTSDDDDGGNFQFALSYTAGATQSYYLEVRHNILGATWSGPLNYHLDPPASLTSSLALTPQPAVVGEWAEVVLTVTNTGTAPATGVLPHVQANAGGTLVNLETGPVPPGPVILNPGISQSFTWTYSASGNGHVEFTSTATGADQLTSFPIESNPSTRTLGISPLIRDISVAPNPAVIGDWVEVVLTVTNAGSVDVTDVRPGLRLDWGGALVNLESGPVPPGPLTLGSGAAQSFTWTLSVSGWGAVGLTASATGTDTATTSVAETMATGVMFTSCGACAEENGIIATVAGNGISGYIGDGVPPTSTRINYPHGVLYDPFGNLYVADTNNHRVRKVDAITGLISTVAGTGVGGYNGDGIPAASAQLYYPYGMAVDGRGNLFIADRLNYRVRRVDGETGLISSVAGTGSAVDNGDAIPAKTANVHTPSDVEVAPNGDVYIAESGRHRVRRIDAATGLISAVAGVSGTFGWNGDGVATASWLNYPYKIALGPGGYLYIADSANYRVRKVDLVGNTITTIAGTGAATFSGDGGLATAAAVNYPHGVAVDGAGNVYIADRNNNRIRRIDAGTGVIRTIAGTGTASYNGDGRDAKTAWLSAPSDVALDGACRVYVADRSNYRIRRIDPAPLDVALAVSPNPKSVGQWMTVAMTVTNTGAYGVADVLPGLVVTSGAALVEYQGGPAPPGPVTLAPGAAATFEWTYSVSGSGTVWFSATTTGTEAKRGLPAYDYATGGYSLLRAAELVADLAVVPPYVMPGDWFQIHLTATNTGQVSASSAVPHLDVTVGAARIEYQSGPVPPGPFVLGPGGSQTFVWTYSASGMGGVAFTGTVTGTDGGTGAPLLDGGNDGVLTISPLDGDLSVTPALPVVGQSIQVVFGVTNTGVAVVNGVTPEIQVNRGGGLVSYVSGPTPAGGADLGAGASAFFTWVYDVSGAGAIEFTATAFGTDSGSGTPVNESDTRSAYAYASSCPSAYSLISTLAGTGTAGYNGDSQPATTARIWNPMGVAIDSSGNVFICDYSNHRVRRVDAVSGQITTIAGTGVPGFNGDGIAATMAQVWYPAGVTVAPSGDVFIAEDVGQRVRRVEAGSGLISTVAGNGVLGYNGDGMPAALAQLSNPVGLALDSMGNLYIAEYSESRVRRVSAATGFISTITGGPPGGYGGDGGPAQFAQIWGPAGLACDGMDDLLIADSRNHRVRRIDAATQIISTIAGTVTGGYNGDGIPGVFARLSNPTGVATDGAGNVFIAENGGQRVRRVDAVTGIISTEAGTGSGGYNGDVIDATTAQLSMPYGIAVDNSCRIYVGDTANQRVRQISPAGLLRSALVVVPSPAAVGSWITVNLTTTNVGGADVTGIVPSLDINIGPSFVNFEAGPAPSGPLTLQSGEAQTFVWTYSVSGAGMTVFTGTASGTDSASGQAVLDGATNDVTTQVPASLTGSLVVDPSGVMPGTWFEVRFTVTNDGTVNATGVTPAIQVNAGAANLNLEDAMGGPLTLAGGTSTTFVWTYSVSGCGGADFTVTATGVDLFAGGGIAVVKNGGVVPTAPALGLTALKELAPGSPAIGGPVTYRIVVTNTGGATVTGLIVVDTVSPVVVGATSDRPAGFPPAVVTSVSGGTRYAWSSSGGLDFQPGQSLTFTITGLVGEVCISTPVSNTAFVRAVALCGAQTVFTNRADFTIAMPVLSFSAVKELDPPAPAAGEGVVYRLVVTNTGQVTIGDLTVVDTVSSVVTGVTTDQPPSFGAPVVAAVPGTGTRYVWSATGISLYPGKSLTFTVTGQVGAVCSPVSVSNTAYVGGGTACGKVAGLTNAVGFGAAPPALNFEMFEDQIPSSPGIGETVTYRIVVSNNGAATVTDVLIVDTVSPVVVGAGVDQPSGWPAPAIVSVAGAGTRYAWSRTGLTMGPGVSYTFTITGKVGAVCAPTRVSNTAYAAGTSACGTDGGLTGPVGFTTQPPVTSVSVSKEQSPASPASGSPITYRIVVTNSGTATLTDVLVVDTVSPVVTSTVPDQPAGIAAPLVGQVAGGTRYVWSGTGLSFLPGTSLTFTVTGIVGVVSVPVGVSNTGYAAVAGACGGASALAPLSGYTLVPNITLEGSVATFASTVSVGQSFFVTLTVSNTGTSPAANVSATVWRSTGGPADATIVEPTPASIPILAGGANVTFTWTMTAATAGPAPAQWTASGWADGGYLTATVPSSAVTIQAPAALVAHVAVVPDSFCTGQSVDVVVTITNTGQATANGVNVAALYEEGAMADNTLVSSPALPASLAGGAGQSFTWVYQGAGAVGAGAYSTTPTGTDANSGASADGVAAGAGLVEGSSPVLEVIASARTTVSTGQTFAVTMTVSNTGGTTATGVSGTVYYGALAALASGPSPALIGSLGAGGNTDIVWQFTAVSAGSLALTTTANGIACGKTPVSDSAGRSVTIEQAATLNSTISVDYLSRVAGQLVVVTMSVTNAGQATANVVMPNPLTVTGVSGVLAGPSPASIGTLAGLAMTTFEWTFTPTGAGVLVLTGNAKGTDANSDAGVASVVSASPAVTVLSPATITASLALSPAGLARIGDAVTATLGIRNTGQEGATVFVAYGESETDPAAVGPGVPASPIFPVTLPAGGTWTGAWQYVAGACGSATVNVAVSGTAWITGWPTAPVTDARMAIIRGQPSSLVVNQSEVRGRVGGIVAVDAQVLDSCTPANPVSGISLDLAVEDGSGFVTPPGAPVTDANGAAGLTYHLGHAPGTNRLVVGVPGTSLSGTVLVEGTVPDVPTPYLTTNTFDPGQQQQVQIRVMVPHEMRVTVRIYNLAGEMVRQVNDTVLPAGLTVWKWDGRNSSGEVVANGSYFVQIVSGKDTQIKRVIVLKR